MRKQFGEYAKKFETCKKNLPPTGFELGTFKKQFFSCLLHWHSAILLVIYRLCKFNTCKRRIFEKIIEKTRKSGNFLVGPFVGDLPKNFFKNRKIKTCNSRGSLVSLTLGISLSLSLCLTRDTHSLFFFQNHFFRFVSTQIHPF